MPSYTKECFRVQEEDALASVRDTLEEAYRRAPDADWVVNVTGGTKPMSIAAYQFFSGLSAKLVYLNAPHPDVLLDLRTGHRETCAYRPSVREYLAGYGYCLAKVHEAVAEDERRARDRAALYRCRVIPLAQVRELAARPDDDGLVRRCIISQEGVRGDGE